MRSLLILSVLMLFALAAGCESSDPPCNHGHACPPCRPCGPDTGALPTDVEPAP